MKKWSSLKVYWTFGVLILLSACGKENFQKADYTTSIQAGQYIYIKPKLDLVVFQDNSDSLTNSMTILKPQLNNFLKSLDSKWEYRVIVMPLLFQQTVSQKYVFATDCSSISGVASCLTTSQADLFNSQNGDSAWINSRNSAVGNTDLGFANMNYNINHLISSNFLRTDAALAMVVISDGEDMTNVAIATRPDGSTVGVDYTSAITTNSFNAYRDYFIGLKSSIDLNKFYAVVSAQRYSGCNGAPGVTWAGKRYMDMASSLGGASFDLCNNAFPHVLNDVSASLQTVIQTVIFDYIVLDNEPDTNTITLTKNGVNIPESSTNGWTYERCQSRYTSYYPTSGNYRSGYMIQLHGSATIRGTDQISVTYQRK